MPLQTEFEFTLPKGYVRDGEVHTRGLMRLATAADEILPLKDPRVQANESYQRVIVLSRVVTRLGAIDSVNPKIIEDLYLEDFAFLEDFYDRINSGKSLSFKTKCPKCNETVEVTYAPGES